MKSKFRFLTKESIKKKINTKWFKVINIVLLILIPLLMNIDSVIKFFGGDFEDEISLYVYDSVNMYDEFEHVIDESYIGILDNYNAVIKKSDKSLEELKKEIKEDEKKDIIIEITPSSNIFDASIISYEYIDTLLYQDITNALNTVKSNRALLSSGIDQNLLNEVYKTVSVNRVVLNEELDENGELMTFVGGIIIAIFIIPFFFLTIMIVQMIGAEINEEKTSKSMEIIISSVSPETHFMSKLISANVFAILQGFLLIAYTFVGIIIRACTTTVIPAVASNLGEFSSVNDYVSAFLASDTLDTIVVGIPFFIILMLLSFLAYSLLTGVLASMTTSMEDFQQLQSPIMIFLMIGYYLAIIASFYNGALFIKIAAYIPFISGILAPVLYTAGQITILDLSIAIVLLAGVCYLLYKYGLKIYKVGILNYSSNKLWKKIFKSLKD